MLERQAQPTDISPTRWEVNFATTNHLELALQLAKTHNYKALEWLILLKNDALEGIQSHIALDSHYPTGIALVRETPTSNTTNPLPPGHPLIESNNLLLRALSTFRGIDWALTKANKTDIQLQLRNSFLHLIEEIKQFQSQVSQGQSPYSDLASMERIFNLFLKHALIQAGLTDGLNTEQDFESILTHYRNLASTLDPAKSMVTIQHYDSITHTETAYPITQKTPVQLEQLRVMASPETSGENFHSAHVPAFRIANAYFYELITQQDRRLPAGCRSTIAPTVKNAYVVHNQLRAADNSLIAELWLTRGGSLAYIGPGEIEDSSNNFVVANLEQLQEHVARLRYQRSDHTDTKLHLAILLTNSRLESQSTIVATSKAGKERFNTQHEKFLVGWSDIPLNAEGFLTRPLEISSTIKAIARESQTTLPSQVPEIISPSNFGKLLQARTLNPIKFYRICQGSRLEKAVNVINIASQDPETTSYVACASGQDRTGTALEAVIQQWLITHNITHQQIYATRAVGYHNALLAGLATPGSTGMKRSSQPSDFFPSAMIERFYRPSADTNADTLHSNPLITIKEAMVAAHKETLAAAKNGTQEKIRCALTTWLLIEELNQKPAVSFRADSVAQSAYTTFAQLPAERETSELLEKISTAMQSDAPDLLTLAQEVTAKKMLYKNSMFEQLDELIQLLQTRFSPTPPAMATM